MVLELHTIVRGGVEVVVDGEFCVESGDKGDRWQIEVEVKIKAQR